MPSFPNRRLLYLLLAMLLAAAAFRRPSLLHTLRCPPRFLQSSQTTRWLSTGPPPPNPALELALQYKVSVAFQAKDREALENKFVKEKKRSMGVLPPTVSGPGEDNYFIAIHDASHMAMGVADGVGGWSELGFDSSAILRELCNAMARLYAANQLLNPRQLLTLAYQEVQQSDKVEIGGTTACLGTVNKDGLLKVANLGDSWCGVFRDSKCVEKTNFQTHGFNTPFQLAKIPTAFLKKAQLQGKKYIMDTPKSADEYEFQLERGDVVMFATDGVTDNIEIGDMEIFIRDNEAGFLKGTEAMDATAKTFVSKVVTLSKDVEFPSVFAQELSRLSGQKYLGGKEDDVTVLMVKVF